VILKNERNATVTASEEVTHLNFPKRFRQYFQIIGQITEVTKSLFLIIIALSTKNSEKMHTKKNHFQILYAYHKYSSHVIVP